MLLNFNYYSTETNNYLRPASDLKEMLNRNGVQNTLGMVDEEFKQGLINFF